MRRSTQVPLAPLPMAKKDRNPSPRYRRRFHAMVKPVGASCNLACEYCFYLHKEELLQQQPGHRMTSETLELFIRQYIEGQDGDNIVFSWQGGEPTLAGLEFFEEVVRLQGKYKPVGQTIQNDLQTNGVLLDKDWCMFLRRNNFLVGLSIDGPKELHDRYRFDRGGQSTFDRVVKNARLLQRHRVRFNTLTTVNRLNARHPLEVYRFLTRQLGSTYVQFNPCVEPAAFCSVAPQFWEEKDIPLFDDPKARPGAENSVVTPWSVDPEDWGDFLCAIFDEWAANDLGRVLVNIFETAVAQTAGMPGQTCVSGEICGKGVAVEHDGEVYSCDHYAYPEYRLGNIREHTLAEMVFSERQKAFGLAKRDSLPQACLHCPHGMLCWGECPKNRLLRAPDGETGLNYLCLGQQKFFRHAKPKLREIAAMIPRQGNLGT